MKVDAIFRGRFNTFDTRRSAARAIAVMNGRIVAFDNDADSLDADIKQDFGDSPIFPGFHDAHTHTANYGIGLRELDLSTPTLTTMSDLYEAVHAAALGLARDQWVIGSGYDQNKLGGAHPDRRRLDEAASGRPVWLRHTSGHMCAVNTTVLELIGSALNQPVVGGHVRRDGAGEPTGLLEERAQSLVHFLRAPQSIDDLAMAIGDAHDRYLAEGLTSACEAGIAGGWVGQSPLELAAYQRARDLGLLKVRTTAMIAADVLHDIGGGPSDGITSALDAGMRTGLGDEWLRVGALKIFSDGSLIGRTCWMHRGFVDDASNTGYPQSDPASLRQTILAAHKAGWQIATHAIGDAAVDFVLDCYGAALAAGPPADHRHRIEHCGVASDDAVARIARLGVIPVPQGRFIGEIGDGMLAALGKERARNAYRLRSFLAAGITLPGSSDRPVVNGRPLLGIRDMVARRTESGTEFAPEEALTPEEALLAYTLGSAKAARCEHERGILAVGMLADFVVLAADPRDTPTADIADIPVTSTVVGGRIAYSAAAD